MNINHLILIVFLMTSNAGCQSNSLNSNSNASSDDMSKKVESDSFIGIFMGEYGGTSLKLIINKVGPEQYEIFLNGEGPDQAKLSGNELEGTSSGLIFRIRKIQDGLNLNISNNNITFLRESLSKENDQKTFQKFESNTLNNNSDPFEGSFFGTIDNGPVKVKFDKINEREYSFYFNGLGPMTVSKIGNAIQVTESGYVFRFEPNANGLLLKGNGKTVELNRENVNTQETDEDLFSGQYDLAYQGQIRDKWTIRKINNSQYQLSSPKGSTMATKGGNKLKCYDASSGTSIIIEYLENQLIMNIAGTIFKMINKQPLSQVNQNMGNNADPRLFGLWVGSKSHNSYGGVGTASIASSYKYYFKQDGTYETVSSIAGGGANWGGSTSEPIETGNYQILSTSIDGGYIDINGNQVEYTFYSGGNKMKMGGIIYERR